MDFHLTIQKKICAAALSLVMPSLLADTKPSHHYYDGSQSVRLTFNPDTIAIRPSEPEHFSQGSTHPSWISENAVSQLSQTPFIILDKHQLLTLDDHEVLEYGWPVLFSEEPVATGILLAEAVVALRQDAQAKKIFSNVEGLKGFLPHPLGNSLFQLYFDDPISTLAAVSTLSKKPSVRFAQPDFVLPVVDRSRQAFDPYFSEQWHLRNLAQTGGRPGADISAPEAWEQIKAPSEVVIAVIDGGFAIDHEDLRETWIVNPNEIPENGIDDDHNGFVDDVYGWNFKLNDNNLGPGIAARHGTAVAGVIGAGHNGLGLMGVCPFCKMIPIVYAGRPSLDAQAFYYGHNRGTDIYNNSWGYHTGTPGFPVVEEAISFVATHGRSGLGSPVVFGMNNYNIDDCSPNRRDISSLPWVIAVSASSDLDRKVHSSGWGRCLDILAPSGERERSQIATTD